MFLKERCKYCLVLLLSLCLIAGCGRKKNETNLDDLNSIKKNFLLSIFENTPEESPFHMEYTLKTVFFSADVVSLFGAVYVYDHLPHGFWRHEGKTFCRNRGELQEVQLGELFPTITEREFLRKYCEDALKADSLSYFSGKNPLRIRLEYEDLCTFVLDDKFLIILFQPYTVAGLNDDPCHIKIPYEQLKGHWNSAHPLLKLLDQTRSSKPYTTSWD